MIWNFSTINNHFDTVAVVRDTKMIEKIYLERFEQNYANTGEAFGNDALVLSDKDFCKAYVVVAYHQVDFMYGKNWRDMIYEKTDNSF